MNSVSKIKNSFVNILHNDMWGVGVRASNAFRQTKADFGGVCKANFKNIDVHSNNALDSAPESANRTRSLGRAHGLCVQGW